MLKHSFFWVFIVLSLQCTISAKGQVYVADTLITDFKKDSLQPFNYSIKVTDFREEGPNFISIYEKKKWLFFPVDQIVLTSLPVAKSFENKLNNVEGKPFQLDIFEFYISNSESSFNRTLSLSGSFQLSKIELNGDTTLMGMFYYENSIKNKKKKPVDQSYSEVINTFKTNFIADLSVICADTLKTEKPSQYHFRKGVGVAPKNLYVAAEAFYGYTFWGFDAEIWFSAPEPAQKFSRNSRIFRYLNYGNRQSVAFSAGVNQFNYRLNSNWLFQNKSVFLLGFNKWNDVDEEMRTIEEIFLFQTSMTQRICFNKLDKSGFVFGAGLIEEASYIIYNDPIFSIGAVLTCSYKF